MLLWAALATGSVEEQPHWQAAAAHFQAFRYDEAYAELQQLLDVPMARGDRARVRLWMARIDMDLGRVEAARDGFRSALELDEGVALPVDVAPRTRALFDEERAARPPAQVPAPADPPPPKPAVAAAPTAPVADAAPLSWPTALMVGGTVVGAAGVALWGMGVGGYLAAEQSEATQVEVAEAGAQAAWLQGLGQATLAAGLVAVVVGGVVAATSP